MQRPRRRTIALAAVGLVLVGGGVVTAVTLAGRADAQRDDAARSAAEAVVAAWTSEGGLAAAPVVAADGGGAQDVAGAYDAVVAGMGGLRPQVEVVDVERTEDAATADLEVTWPVAGAEDGWGSATTLPLAVTGDDREASGWTATWSPSALEPSLEDGDALRLDRVRAERGTVLDRDGDPLVVDRPVVDVQVDPARVEDPAALAQRLSAELGVDAASLADRITSAPEGQAVPVITLREDAWAATAEDVRSLPGVQTLPGELPLAPTTDFARALLGVVGDATAEVVEASQGRVAAGDTTGLSGLQAQYDERLAGAAGATVVRVPGGAEGGSASEEDGADGDPSGDAATAPEQTLYSAGPVAGQDVQVSLDPDVQVAADEALAAATGDGGQGALVVVDVGSGDLLAVSSAPSTGLDRAMQGRYAPGSTFKTVSTQALLAAGLSVDETVACPATVTVGGRDFVNAGGEELGDVPFSTDFAQSCNTAFVSLADRLDAGALTTAAAPMGIGAAWDVGVPVYTGEVPEAQSADVRGAEMIGQGQVQVSPAGMAVATSTVARGSWLAPRLVLDPAPEEGQAPPEPVADLAVVRDLMGLVATEGTAADALADVPGAPVGAKTGTAELGEPGPDGSLATNAWTVALQPGTGPAGPDGDGVAVAALVEGGSAGGAVAAPVVADLLTALADRG